MPTGYPDYYQGFQQPSYLYVSATDVLRIAAASSQTGETITVNYRQMLADRSLVTKQFTISPGSDRSISTKDETLEEGFLLSVSCKASAATTRGQTFARIFLTNATLGLGEPTIMFMSDYVTTRMAGSWPNGRVLTPVEGPGWLRSISITNPPSGEAWSETVPTNARWRINSALATFTASASVLNRQLGCLLTVGGNSAFEGWAESYVTAGVSTFLTYSPTRNLPADSPDLLWVPIPHGMKLLAADVIQGTFVTIGAADQYSKISLAVEEWLDNV